MSISRRLVIWTFISFLIICSAGLFVHYRMMSLEVVHRLKFLGDTMGPIIEAAVSDFMLTRDASILDNTIQKLASLKQIENILLVNGSGTIKAGINNYDVGKVFHFPKTPCSRCLAEERQCILIEEENIFRWIQPIKNLSECRTCHAPGIRNLGAIVVDFSLDASRDEMRGHIAREWFIFIILFALVGFVIYYLTNALVIKRLKAIGDQIGRFKKGDYDTRISITGNDELSALADSFNALAEKISVRDREKDDLIDRISRSQREWRLTFDCITDLISIHDNEYRIVRANKAFFDYFGIAPKDISNQPCYCLFHEPGSPHTNCPHRESLSKNSSASDVIVDPKTGRIFRVTTFPYYSSTGVLIGSVHIARDITDEREREIRLIMSERLAALGQMASGIAHELNNPLAAIAGCAEGLLNRMDQKRFEPEVFRNYLRIISEEVSHCRKITADILSFVRKPGEDKEMVDIHTPICKAIETAMHQGRLKNVEVIKKFGDNIPRVSGNEDELKQAIVAIMVNALDAMEDKGTLTIETGIKGRTVFIKIADTGPGIPKELIQKIFSPFFTTKSQGRGTGLGLSIAQKIILDHHGAIDVASEQGRGAVFTINLPV